MASVCFLVLWTLVDLARVPALEGSSVAVWDPADALEQAFLLVFGLPYGVVLLLTGVLRYLLTDPTPVALGPALSLQLVAVVGEVTAVALALRVARIDPRLPRLRDLGWLLTLCAVVGPFVEAVLEFFLARLFDLPNVPGGLLAIAGEWAGDATGAGLAVPLLLLARRWPGLWRTVPGRKPANRLARVGWPGVTESAVLSAMIAAALYMAYFVAPRPTIDYSYLVIVPVVWAAVRGGLAWVAPTALVANVGVVLVVVNRQPQGEEFALQLLLATVTLLGLLLGGVVDQRQRAERALEHSAFHDPLTDLANRALLSDRLEHALRRLDRRPQAHVGLLLIDLDRFKNVNDSLGHLVGDELLRQVADRLRETVRPADTAARFGGDEFVVLLVDLEDPADAVHAVERLLEALSRPFELQGQSLQITASIGVAVNDRKEHSAEDLLRNADAALHEAKDRGRSGYALFNQGMHTEALECLRLEQDLRGALSEGELAVVYQPIVELATATPVGAEALLRWRHPERGQVDPERFIGVAEDTGLIIEIGVWVLRQACAQARSWLDAGHSLGHVAVNISSLQLTRPQLVGQVTSTLDEFGLRGPQLHLELTESVLSAPSVVSDRNLHRLSDLGIGIAIDDFGTGHSALSNLLRFPIDVIKLDRGFVARLPEADDAAAIVEAVLALAHRTSRTVVAEGVETAEQSRFLFDHGCELAQGHLFGRPVPASELDLPPTVMGEAVSAG